ncbi:MAG: HD domain-containing protein, partial [Proteobacteria bacterium]|nr:HD domain-containing protein [Pseudomonadota bacterium]
NYRSITDNALNGIYQTTKDGKFLMANPAFFSMLGYASFEEMAASITDITHEFYVNPEDRQYVKRILEKEDTIRKFETQFYKKDRSKMWVSINMRNVRDADGTFLYYEGIDEDITFRKQAEEDLKQTTEKLRKSLAGTIQAMSLTVETRDPYTAGHQRKVSSLARTIAQEMGLSKDAVENIRMAGIIHDIGKISVPAEILVKPGKISDIEMSLIKVHPQSGYDILKDVELPYPIAEIVLQHHERLDGSGYPQGLKGDQILLEAKIVSVADVVEAIASHRPYRPAKGIEAAFEEIERNKGTLYDAETVEVCLKLFREKGFSFEPTES